VNNVVGSNPGLGIVVAVSSRVRVAVNSALLTTQQVTLSETEIPEQCDWPTERRARFRLAVCDVTTPCGRKGRWNLASWSDFKTSPIRTGVIVARKPF